MEDNDLRKMIMELLDLGIMYVVASRAQKQFKMAERIGNKANACLSAAQGLLMADMGTLYDELIDHEKFRTLRTFQRSYM